MRREVVYLEDIVRAAGEILDFTRGRKPADLVADAQFRNAVLFSLTVIGEAANSLSTEFQSTHPEVPWRELTALRNRIVHGYFALDDGLIWEIVTIQTPVLSEQVAEILRVEFPR